MIHLTLHQLSAYLDGELTEASTELVRLHLTQCAECTDRFARMEVQEEILIRLLNHDPGDAFFEFFHRAVTLDGREEPPTWPRPAPPSPEPGPSVDLVDGPAGPEPDVGIPLGDLEASFEGDPEALIPNVDRHEPAEAPAGPTRSEPRTTPAPPPVHSPMLYGRRDEDRERPRRRSAAAGWIVAIVMAVVALSVAVVTTRPRVSPLPIPDAADGSHHRESPAPPAESAAAARGAARPDADPPSVAGAEAVEDDSLPEATPPEAVEDGSGTDLLDLPVWARAKSIQPPPPPRARTRAAGSVTTPAPAPAPTPAPTPAPEAVETGPATADAQDPAAIDRDFDGARRASLRAADARNAPAFEAAAAAWETLRPRLAGDPEREAVAWREGAQARFQAWAAAPTTARRDAAIHAVRGYLLYAPPGPDRDQAWTWLGRLKQSAGAPPR